MLDKVLKVIKIIVWVIFGVSCIISTWWSIATSKTFFHTWNKKLDENVLFEEDEA